MAKAEDFGEVVSTDVLIVGGGLGGLVAAIKAKEYPVDVLVVEKETVGYSGKAPKGGGVIACIAPQDDLDGFAEHHVRNIGDYLNDQDLLYSLARETSPAVQQLAAWGVHIRTNEDGKIALFEHFYGIKHCSLAAVDLDMLLPLRTKARKMGAKIMNKVQVVELLRQDDRVVGAVGFDLINGRFYIFKAKATILANGSCSYKVQRMWATASGEGIAAAYRAGAEMRNAEFGNFYDVQRKDTGAAAPGGHRFLFNALGENLFEQYVSTESAGGDIHVVMALGMEKEIMEGRGPICMDLLKRKASRTGPSFASLWERPKYQDFVHRTESKELKYGPSASNRPEVTLGLLGELSPIKVDHEMKTSLAGLWAIGDTSHGGSAWAGAVPAPPGRIRGSGLMYAVVSALRAAPSAVRFAADAEARDVNGGELKRLKEAIFAPMQSEKGLLPDDAVRSIQDVVVPVKYSLRRSKARLEEG